MMYSIAICDDDNNYVEYLDKEIRNQLKGIQKFTISKFYSGEQFLSIKGLKFDLIFLDMQMKKINGINTALNYRRYDQDAILVFCTGIQMPRPEFFDVQPFRYLMKSYSHFKMQHEIGIVLSKMIESRKENYYIAFLDGKMQKISISDILYISNLKRGSCIHCYSQKERYSFEVNTNKKLLDIHRELENLEFEYAHNSYLVNFEAIIGLSNEVITLQDLSTLNISRSKKNLFHSKFSEYLGGKYKRD